MEIQRKEKAMRTFEEIKDKIKTVIEVLEANKSYLF